MASITGPANGLAPPSPGAGVGDSIPAAAISAPLASAVAAFLARHRAYDILPVSAKVVLLDARLPLKKALAALLLNHLTAAPLWHSDARAVSGLLTVRDLVRLVAYYADDTDDADEYEASRRPPSELDRHQALVDEVEALSVDALRALSGADPMALVSLRLHPLRSLREAVAVMYRFRLHHVPLVDTDPASGQDAVVGVLTGGKVLKFLACNCPVTRSLTISIRDAGIGMLAPAHPVVAVSPHSLAVDAVRLLAQHNISALPVIDDAGRLLDVFTETDVMYIVRDFPATSLLAPVHAALTIARPADAVEPIHTCTADDTIASLFAAIQRAPRVTRFVVVDSLASSVVVGMVSLGDLLGLVAGGDGDDLMPAN
ncbi:hypothetical protein BC828DRAFT_407216 [Blastocladiella britannica]|nr:hypothetical protein BC828DRAFT_407216 [Blastocladiella britannica]